MNFCSLSTPGRRRRAEESRGEEKGCHCVTSRPDKDKKRGGKKNNNHKKRKSVLPITRIEERVCLASARGSRGEHMCPPRLLGARASEKWGAWPRCCSSQLLGSCTLEKQTHEKKKEMECRLQLHLCDVVRRQLNVRVRWWLSNDSSV